MAKKKIELFIDINNEKEFEYMLDHNLDRLICADVYSTFAGPCTALDHLFVRVKLDWGDGQIVLLRVRVDEINSLRRFQNQSEPVFLFIYNRKITRVFRGVDYIRFAEVAKREVECFKLLKEGNDVDRETFELDEASFDEQEWHKKRTLEKQQEEERLKYEKEVRQMSRKRHRAELMVPHLQHLNFVLFWPYAVHAHFELYERWDVNNIIMVGREEVNLTKELAEDIFYAGDAVLNEASLHKLLSGSALAICFRLLDLDKHFVSLVRKILYEEIIPLDERKSSDRNKKTAFDLYKSYSSSREEIWEKRREERLRKREEAKEKRARRLSEMQRLARQAIEDAIQIKRAQKEQRKLELLKSGNLSALEKLRQDVEDEEVDIIVPEELSEEGEEVSEEEDENEYFPPPGLLIPGFYSPPNDIAKANGLAILFPNLVSENVVPEPEFLPPHVLVLLDIAKRYKAIEVMEKFKQDIIHMGIFNATHPYDAVHVAYSVKQFDKMNQKEKFENLKLAFMVSTKSDLALLELIDLGPAYVSRDEKSGEVECAVLFTVDYGDNYPEFEDFE